MREIKLCDTVSLPDGRVLTVDGFSDDHGTRLSDGRWVCASELEWTAGTWWSLRQPVVASTYAPEPVDFSEPRAVIMRKAAEGAFWYALRAGGWTDEQIHNGLKTYRDTIAHELADLIRANCDMRGVDLPGPEDAADFIDPEVS